MQGFVENTSKPNEVVAGLLSGTCATAMSCFELSHHLRFVVCEVHAECFASSRETLVKTYAKQMLNEKSKDSGSNEAVDASKIVVRAFDGLHTRKWIRPWRIPVGLFPVHISPSCTTHSLPNLFVDPFLFEKRRLIHFNRCSSTGRAGFHLLKLEGSSFCGM